jgi:hypothetical protein
MADTTTTDVHADVVLALPAAAACERLGALLHTGVDADTTAPLRLSVGPTGGRFPSKQVAGDTSGPRHLGSSYVWSLRWEPVGVAATAYPALDANLAVTPVDSATSLLSILAHYRPPFGALGAAADRIAMSRVATATVTSVLRRLAVAVQGEPATAGV